MGNLIEWKYVVASLLYSVIGILILVITFVIVELITPDNLRKEIIQNKNTAVAIIATGFMISIAIIIASAIH
jgi:uncharacterized membrane protein YjfL (UPF0719 family)